MTDKTLANKRLIELFTNAQKLSQVSIYLGYLAIIAFCVFGTLASMASFRQNGLVYWAFHYLPYVLIGVSVPISLYHAFLMFRYRIMQAFILSIVLLTGVLLPLVALGFWLFGNVIGAFMSLFLAMIAWFAMPFLFRVNIKRYLKFLTELEQ